MRNLRQVVWSCALAVAVVGCKKSAAPAGGATSASGAGDGPGTSGAAAPGPRNRKATLGGRPGETPFEPSTQGFKFQNYGNEDGVENLTAAELERMFGPDVCAERVDGECVLTPAAERWMDETNEGMDDGHCEGLATVALLFETGKLRPADFGAPTAFALELAGNRKLQAEIAYWFSTQYLSPVSEAEIATLTPVEVADRLAHAFTTGDDSYTIGIYMRDGSGGHATTPYAVVDKSDTETWILQYDNNYPGEERHIAIDRVKNTWAYVTSSNPKEAADNYDGDATTHTLTLAPTSVRLRKLECPFCGEVDDPGDDAARARGGRRITLDGDADLLITDDTGKRLGHVGGALVSEIPGGRAIPARAAGRKASAEPVYQVPAGHALTVTLDGAALAREEASDVSLVAPGYTMGVYGVELDPGQRDTVTFSADWKQVTYRTDSDATPDLELGVATTAADWTFTIRAAGEQGGQQVAIELDAAAGTLAVEAAARDGHAQFEVEIERDGDDGVQTFRHKGVAAGAKDRFVFAYGAWKGNGTDLAVGVDHGDDGSVDDEATLDDEE